jgi:hypothetical protein
MGKKPIIKGVEENNLKNCNRNQSINDKNFSLVVC